MTERYQRELEELPVTFARACRASVEKLQRACLDMAAGPALFVGTGGTLALAQLASQLHTALSYQLSATATPLEFLQAPGLNRCGALFFSARAKHPDAQLVIERLSSGDFRPAVLITHRDPRDLERTGNDLEIIKIDKPGVREGFLATNSVLAMATHLVRAFGETVESNVIEGIEYYEQPALRDRPDLLILYPPNLKPVAIDLETRCSELGIATVQITDLRNFAHGRHTGLARRQRETSVLMLSDGSSEVLASKVEKILGDSNFPVVRWHTDLSNGAACLRLLALSMIAIGRFAEEGDVDPARPQVPEFGRRLYNLPIKKILRREPEGPVESKVRALHAGPISKSLSDTYEQAFAAWRKSLSQVKLGALVVDYDGTVCTTRERYGLPSASMQAAIIRVLEGGLLVGFASGRGKSIYEDLRKWVPNQLWPRIELGLYNGSVKLGLADELPDLHTPSKLMANILDRLSSAPFANFLKLEARAGQVSIGIHNEAFFHHLSLTHLVSDLLEEKPAISAKVVASGHSVDVLAPDTTKVTVLHDLEEKCGRPTLAIGDQGQSGGNDFELLAATPWSISVDRCSADPTRCWRVGRAGRRGPAALEEVLKTLKIDEKERAARLVLRPLR